ncbi:hypothetical protein CC80DRAFT_555646 [Byssothecium circinans]|uniref:Uncharacterized protein n=1 Tax=Byssothecium circinans TaxID=147558 RepID=A0A6A5TA84_9PLEO|nr:hypothetical protein CC80DRAFT_555646 [Byssothecium circinans]
MTDELLSDGGGFSMGSDARKPPFSCGAAEAGWLEGDGDDDGWRSGRGSGSRSGCVWARSANGMPSARLGANRQASQREPLKQLSKPRGAVRKEPPTVHSYPGLALGCHWGQGRTGTGTGTGTLASGRARSSLEDTGQKRRIPCFSAPI